MKKEHYIHVLHGFIAGSLLLLAYFAIVGTLQGVGYAIDRFVQLWYLMIPLVIGFGFQIGLFSCIRNAIKVSSKASATSGGVSTVSMIACCAHHVTDVVPILGASAIGIFLLEYQPAFLVMGIVSNIIGSTMMLRIAQQSGLKFKSPFFRRLMALDLNSITKIFMVAGAGAIIASFILLTPLQLPAAQSSSTTKLEPLSETQNNVTFSVSPLGFGPSDDVQFQISVNTHSVPLNFNLMNVSTLVADGKELRPTSWNGSTSMGHHMLGALKFAPLGYTPNSLKLIVTNASNLNWTFEWNLTKV